MSDAERDRLIRETHANMAVVASYTHDLRETVYGANGNPGIKADVQRIDLQQKSCPARLRVTTECSRARAAWVAIAVVIAVEVINLALKVVGP